MKVAVMSGNIRLRLRDPTPFASPTWSEVDETIVVDTGSSDASILRQQLKEAVRHFETAVRLHPESPGHHCFLGYVLTQVGRPADAEIYCRQAIRLQSDFIGAHLNLSTALWVQGRLDEAVQCVEEALRIDPEHPGARFFRALWSLKQGDFALGWPEYEWRWKQPNTVRRPCREPLWDGSPLHGRTILLWADAGLGDTLQTIRFARMVQQRGAKVVVECQAPLVPLLSRCAGIDQLVPYRSAAPEAEVEAPLFSLPWLLGITVDTLGPEVPYIYLLIPFWSSSGVRSWGERLVSRWASPGRAIRVITATVCVPFH
jgi:hypothetical protein